MKQLLNLSVLQKEKRLKAVAHQDEKEYNCWNQITDEDMEKLQIETLSLHPNWNYSILTT